MADRFRRNRKITITTRAMVRTSVNSTSWIDARIDFEASNATDKLTDGGISRRNCGSKSEDAVDNLHCIGARLPLDGENDSALVVEPAFDLIVFDRILDGCELLQSNGGSIAPGDDHRAVGARVPPACRWTE